MDLKRLFELQATLNKRVGLDDGAFQALFSNGEIVAGGSKSYNDRVIEAGRLIDDMLKAMSSEMEELRDHTYWKHWCSEAQRGERYKIKDLEGCRKEVIDILHFWVSLCQILGMDADMVAEMYEAKLAKNIKRQEDGYSIEEKDLAWKIFNRHDYVNPAITSLEDLPEGDQQYWLNQAKDEINRRESENLCNTCVHAENDCSMGVGKTHSCSRYHKKSVGYEDNSAIPTCYKCGRKCTAGYMMSGEGPVCASCVK